MSQRCLVRFSAALALACGPLTGIADEARPAFGEPTTSPLKGEVAGSPWAEGDGVYGRFQSPWSLGISLGGELERDALRGAGKLSLHYLHSAGVSASYRAGRADGSEAQLASLALSLKPLFLPRWSMDLEKGPAVLDLTLDSLALELGVALGSRDDRQSRALELGVGLGVPLLGESQGPWIEGRALLRVRGLDDTQSGVLLLFTWQAAVLSDDP